MQPKGQFVTPTNKALSIQETDPDEISTTQTNNNSRINKLLYGEDESKSIEGRQFALHVSG